MLKKIVKWIFALLIILAVLITIIYSKLNEPLPKGRSGEAADALAVEIMKNLNYTSFKNTRFVEWSFPGGHHYKWNKQKGEVLVKWDANEVLVTLNDKSNSKLMLPSNTDSKAATAIIEKAIVYFNNDSFWLIAPYKLFDKGVSRQLITPVDGKRRLLVTYNKGEVPPEIPTFGPLIKQVAP